MRANFTFRRLEYFVAVGEAGSIVTASEKLNVSPPSISTALVQLEDELRVQLFLRQHAHGMALTGAGRRLFGEAKKMLRHADNLRNIAADLSARVSGDLRIGCLQTVAPLVLPRLRKSFETQFPEVRVHQQEDHQAGLLQALQKADIDLCLMYDLNIPSGVDFLPLADLPAYVMLAVSHPLAKRDFITPADLATEPFILLDLPISSKYFLSMFEHANITPRIVARSKDMALVRSMVANGFGYSLGNIRPRFERAPDGGRLAHVPLKNGLRPMRLGLVSCRTDYEIRAVEAFRRHCFAMIGKGEIPGAVALSAGKNVDKKR